MKNEKTIKNPSKTKIEKSISSLIVIIIILSSILAGSVIYKKFSDKNQITGKAVGLERVSGSVNSKSPYLAHLSPQQKTLFDDAYKKHASIPSGTLEGLCYAESRCREGTKHAPSETSVGPLGITNGVNDDFSESGKYDRKTLGGSIEIAARYTEQLMTHPNYITAASASPEIKANMIQVAYNRGYSNMPTAAQIEDVLRSPGYKNAGIVYKGATGVDEGAEINRFIGFNKVLGTEASTSSSTFQNAPSSFDGLFQNAAYTSNLDSMTGAELSKVGWYRDDSGGAITLYKPSDDKRKYFVKGSDTFFVIVDGIVRDSSNPEYVDLSLEGIRRLRDNQLITTFAAGTNPTPDTPTSKTKAQTPQITAPLNGNTINNKPINQNGFKGPYGELYAVTNEGVWQLIGTTWKQVAKNEVDFKNKLGEYFNSLTQEEIEFPNTKPQILPKTDQKAGTDSSVIKKPTFIITKSGAEEIKVVTEGENNEFIRVYLNSKDGWKESGPRIPISLLDPNDAKKVEWKSYDESNPTIFKFSDGRTREIDVDGKEFTDTYTDKGRITKEIRTTIHELENGLYRDNIKKIVKEQVMGKQQGIGTITKTVTFADDSLKIIKFKENSNDIEKIIYKNKEGKSVDVSVTPFDDILKKTDDEWKTKLFFDEAIKSGITKIDKAETDSNPNNLVIYVGDKNGVHVGLTSDGRRISAKGENLVRYYDDKEGLAASFEGVVILTQTGFDIKEGGTAYVQQRDEANKIISNRIEQKIKGNVYVGEYIESDKITISKQSSLDVYTISREPESDKTSQFYGMYSIKYTYSIYDEIGERIETRNGFIDYGQSGFGAPFGLGGASVYYLNAEGKKVKDTNPELTAIISNLDRERERKSKPTFGQESSQRFFANVEKVFTEFNGLGYYATLFFDEDSLLAWRDNVDRVFATAYLGTEYWSSAICGNYLDGEGEGIAYAETPQGLAQVAAHIEATRTEPIINENGTVSFIYKITFSIRNGDYEKDPRAPEEMNFNIVLKGERIVTAEGVPAYDKTKQQYAVDKIGVPSYDKTKDHEIIFDYISKLEKEGKAVKVFKQDQNVTRGSSFSRSGRSAIVQDSFFLYDEICIIFDKIPSRWKLDNNELCNKVQESAGEATTLASLRTSTSGGRSDEINDF